MERLELSGSLGPGLAVSVVRELADMARSATDGQTLVSLGLRRNNIGPREGVAIAAVLAGFHSSLGAVDLRENPLGPAAVEALASAAQSNSALVSVLVDEGVAPQGVCSNLLGCGVACGGGCRNEADYVAALKSATQANRADALNTRGGSGAGSLAHTLHSSHTLPFIRSAVAVEHPSSSLTDYSETWTSESSEYSAPSF